MPRNATKVQDFSINTPFEQLSTVSLVEIFVNIWKQWQIQPIQNQRYDFQLPADFVQSLSGDKQLFGSKESHKRRILEEQ
jgi:hypothetical protein